MICKQSRQNGLNKKNKKSQILGQIKNNPLIHDNQQVRNKCAQYKIIRYQMLINFSQKIPLSSRRHSHQSQCQGINQQEQLRIGLFTQRKKYRQMFQLPERQCWYGKVHSSRERQRYEENREIKIGEIGSGNDSAREKKGEDSNNFREDIKLKTATLLKEKDGDRHNLIKNRIDNDFGGYYKYWKQKAHEYQELNFRLHRLNSTLRQQNTILKRELQLITKKLSQKNKKQQITNQNDKSNNNNNKLQEYYMNKLQVMNIKMIQQKKLIQNKDNKIKQLSKCIVQNYHIKNLLDNMEDKILSIKSVENSKNSKEEVSITVEESLEKISTSRLKTSKAGSSSSKPNFFYRTANAKNNKVKLFNSSPRVSGSMNWN